MKKDRRQINEIWEHTNPLGERYEYGRVGSGKNSYIKSLKFIGYTPKRKKELMNRIKVYAQHYHSPISDIKGFNQLIKKEFGTTVRRETLRKLLGY